MSPKALLTRAALAGALALTVPATASAAGLDQGPGVPPGQVELTQTTVEITGSNAVTRHERTQQWLTSSASHTIVRKIPSGKLRFEGLTTPKLEIRLDTDEGTVYVGKGSATPPYQTLAQYGRLFEAQLAAGCFTKTGETVFNGRLADTYAKASNGGTCRGEARRYDAVVDRETGYVVQRTVGETDGSFLEVDTVERWETLALTGQTKALLAPQASAVAQAAKTGKAPKSAAKQGRHAKAHR